MQQGYQHAGLLEVAWATLSGRRRVDRYGLDQGIDRARGSDAILATADSRIRGAVFDWLTEQRNSLGEALPRVSLEAFMLDGSRVPLVGPQGIWKPALCELPLSITTVVHGPYSDSFDDRSGPFATLTEGPTHSTATTLGSAV